MGCQYTHGSAHTECVVIAPYRNNLNTDSVTELLLIIINRSMHRRLYSLAFFEHSAFLQLLSVGTACQWRMIRGLKGV
jgi:hypothetical protein